MADVLSSQAIESITESNSVKVSKDLNANAANNPLIMQLSDGTNVLDVTNGNLNVAISDGVNELDLVVIDSAYGATPTAAPVAGKYEATPTTYTDGDATALLTDENGKLIVVTQSTSGGSVACRSSADRSGGPRQRPVRPPLPAWPRR